MTIKIFYSILMHCTLLKYRTSILKSWYSNFYLSKNKLPQMSTFSATWYWVSTDCNRFLTSKTKCFILKSILGLAVIFCSIFDLILTLNHETTYFQCRCSGDIHVIMYTTGLDHDVVALCEFGYLLSFQVKAEWVTEICSPVFVGPGCWGCSGMCTRPMAFLNSHPSIQRALLSHFS